MVLIKGVRNFDPATLAKPALKLHFLLDGNSQFASRKLVLAEKKSMNVYDSEFLRALRFFLVSTLILLVLVADSDVL